MKKLRLVAAAALAGAITVLSPGAAQAYPDCSVSIDVDSTIIGGKTLEFSADVEGGGVDGDFTATFNGDSASGSGSTFSDSFDTPKVDEKTNKVLKVSFSDSESTCTASVTITLRPAGAVADAGENAGDDNGALPDTGGSNLWLLIAGGALVIGGGGVTYAARRRHHSAH